MLERILVANRGEIAVRVMRTCRELGIATVAVYSDLDRESLHVQMADEAYPLGGQTAAESYLNAEAIVAIAARSGADGLHPGYGFLSENAEFARLVEGAGIVFIGPPPAAIEVMGDKISSRLAASAAGVAGVPGRSEAVQSAEEVVAFGEQAGWPVAVKAAFGGGGRGMKLVGGPDEASGALEAARREATAYFGHPEVYLERYLASPRHIEMQILADRQGNIVWLGERDCSAQRRHQKLVEESPAPGLSDETREAMGEAAVRVASACGYVNAGTVEFLYDGIDFFFLEMNTRLQVEHPVTELVTGVDLVEWQIRIASGESLAFGQADIAPRGHAIEARLNAEDPAGGRFLPSPGLLERLTLPSGPWVRVDAGYRSGDEVSQHYDNLLAKLIVWGADRDQARARLLRALGETDVSGVAANTAVLEAIVSHPDFASARHSTTWVENELDLSGLHAAPIAVGAARGAGPHALPEMIAEIDGRRSKVRLFISDPSEFFALFSPPAGRPAVSPAARSRRGIPAGSSWRPAGQSPSPRQAPREPAARANAAPGGAVVAPMQGTVVEIVVEIGAAVDAGQTVCILEAMKMENTVVAIAGGTVSEIRVSSGETVGPGDVLIVLE